MASESIANGYESLCPLVVINFVPADYEAIGIVAKPRKRAGAFNPLLGSVFSRVAPEQEDLIADLLIDQ